MFRNSLLCTNNEPMCFISVVVDDLQDSVVFHHVKNKNLPHVRKLSGMLFIINPASMERQLGL